MKELGVEPLQMHKRKENQTFNARIIVTRGLSQKLHMEPSPVSFPPIQVLLQYHMPHPKFFPFHAFRHVAKYFVRFVFWFKIWTKMCNY